MRLVKVQDILLELHANSSTEAIQVFDLYK